MHEGDLDAVWRVLMALGSACFWLFIIAVIIAILAACSKDREDKR